MKWLKFISTIVMAILFLASSAGILVFQSNCACTGNEEISLYVARDYCEDGCKVSCCSLEEPKENCCTNCSMEENKCNCDEPIITYIKLKDQYTNEEVEFIAVQPLQLMVAQFYIEWMVSVDTENEIQLPTIDPPPLIKSSTDFLIQVNQLKIPLIA